MPTEGMGELNSPVTSPHTRWGSSPVSLILPCHLTPCPVRNGEDRERSSSLGAAGPARASQALYAGIVDAGDNGSLSCVRPIPTLRGPAVTRPSLMRILDSTQHREPDVDRVPSLGTNKKPQLHECDVSHGVLFPFSS